MFIGKDLSRLPMIPEQRQARLYKPNSDPCSMYFMCPYLWCFSGTQNLISSNSLQESIFHALLCFKNPTIGVNNVGSIVIDTT